MFGDVSLRPPYSPLTPPGQKNARLGPVLGPDPRGALRRLSGPVTGGEGGGGWEVPKPGFQLPGRCLSSNFLETKLAFFVKVFVACLLFCHQSCH